MCCTELRRAHQRMLSSMHPMIKYIDEDWKQEIPLDNEVTQRMRKI